MSSDQPGLRGLVTHVTYNVAPAAVNNLFESLRSWYYATTSIGSRRTDKGDITSHILQHHQDQVTHALRDTCPKERYFTHCERSLLIWTSYAFSSRAKQLHIHTGIERPLRIPGRSLPISSCPVSKDLLRDTRTEHLTYQQNIPQSFHALCLRR